MWQTCQARKNGPWVKMAEIMFSKHSLQWEIWTVTYFSLYVILIVANAVLTNCLLPNRRQAKILSNLDPVQRFQMINYAHQLVFILWRKF